MSEIIFKQAPVNLESSENDGYLIGYANMYNVKDLQGDISAPNSFIKTVTERKAKIKIYYGGYITKLERSPTFLKIL